MVHMQTTKHSLPSPYTFTRVVSFPKEQSIIPPRRRGSVRAGVRDRQRGQMSCALWSTSVLVTWQPFTSDHANCMFPCDPTVRYRVHTNTRLVHIMSRLNQIHEPMTPRCQQNNSCPYRGCNVMLHFGLKCMNIITALLGHRRHAKNEV